MAAEGGGGGGREIDLSQMDINELNNLKTSHEQVRLRYLILIRLERRLLRAMLVVGWWW